MPRFAPVMYAVFVVMERCKGGWDYSNTATLPCLLLAWRFLSV
jgi:hypothetical protein